MRASFITMVAAMALATAVAAREAGTDAGSPMTTHPVAGSGVHFFTTAIIHSTEMTPTGMIRRTTETVELNGDLIGRILYHPTSVFDFAAGTLVNTGDQVFSGTVLASAPVLLHDDEFRFEANLLTGAVTGKVYLTDPIAGGKIRCELDVVGTGLDANGNATFNYTGQCRFKP